MDKKAKKRWDVINKKLKTLRVQLAGSKAQADDLDELKELQDTIAKLEAEAKQLKDCLLYTSPSPRDLSTSRMPSSA